MTTESNRAVADGPYYLAHFWTPGRRRLKPTHRQCVECGRVWLWELDGAALDNDNTYRVMLPKRAVDAIALNGSVEIKAYVGGGIVKGIAWGGPKGEGQKRALLDGSKMDGWSKVEVTPHGSKWRQWVETVKVVIAAVFAWRFL